MTATPVDHRTGALEFLQDHQAGTTPHIFGDLLTHLTGVEALARQWGGSELLCLAALGHATYGTHGFEPYILELDQRSVLAAVIGDDAEALVYFYASCDRAAFYPQLVSPDSRLEDLRFRNRFTGAETVPSAAYVTMFVDLTYANEGELAAAAPGGPAAWSWLAQFCRQTRRWASPGFFAGAAALLQLDE